MSKPAIFDTQPLLTATRYGIMLGLYPSTDASFDMELQRSVGSTASTSFSKLTVISLSRVSIPGQGDVVTGGTYTDELPSDNVIRYYRARHVKNGYTAGAYTRIVGARPALLVTGDLKGRNDDKWLDIPFSAFQPVVTSTSISGQIRINQSNGYLYNSNAGGAPVDRRSAAAPVTLPLGAKIVGLSHEQAFSSGAGTGTLAELTRVTTTGLSLLADLDNSTAYGWRTFSTTLSYTHTSAARLTVFVTLGPGIGSSHAASKTVRIRYTNPLGYQQTV